MPSPPTDPHGWNSWQGYLDAHRSKLASLDHFVLENTLQPLLTDVAARWVGELVCADGYEIHVRRAQAVDMRLGVPWVKTSQYSYQALLRQGKGARRLFRYDNIHPHVGHPTPHHRHRFDINGGETLPPVHIGIAQWPNLGQVLDELYEYWRLRR